VYEKKSVNVESEETFDKRTSLIVVFSAKFIKVKISFISCCVDVLTDRNANLINFDTDEWVYKLDSCWIDEKLIL
jgi:hypothetical protein